MSEHLPRPVTTPSDAGQYRSPLDPNGPLWPLIVIVVRRVWPNAATAVVAFLAGLGVPAVQQVQDPPPIAAPEPEGNRIRRAVEDAIRAENKRTREEMLAMLDYADPKMPIAKWVEHMRYEFEPEPGEFEKEPVP